MSNHYHFTAQVPTARGFDAKPADRAVGLAEALGHSPWNSNIVRVGRRVEWDARRADDSTATSGEIAIDTAEYVGYYCSDTTPARPSRTARLTVSYDGVVLFEDLPCPGSF